MDDEEFKVEQDNWEQNQYYEKLDPDTTSITKGFLAESNGLSIFSKLYRFIEGLESSEAFPFQCPRQEVKTGKWKMNFEVEKTLAEITACEDDVEMDEETPEQKLEIEVRLHDNEEGKIYVSFFLKSGCKCDFYTFYNGMMAEEM